MKKFSFSGYDLRAKILWCATLLFGLAVFGFAARDAFAFSAATAVILFVTVVVAALLNQYQFTIPRTKIKVTFNELMVFWTIIWLGVSGSVLVAAGASIAGFAVAASTNKKRRLFDTAANSVSAFAAGQIFYLTLKFTAGFSESVVAASTISFVHLLAAIAVMAASYYALSAAFTSVFLNIEKDFSTAQTRKQNLLVTAANYSLGVAATFALHFAFLEFGLFFGLVILPAAVVGHFAYRMHIARLTQKTREISEASRVHLATVEALATAIDARDQVGVGHVRRTQIYAVGIGKTLDLSAGDLEALNTGALLHDIGKLAVPDHILNKPGKLTPAELEKTKIHASVGASILEKINFPYPVVPTVKYHHEMWDGNGYPEGLSKENIPLTARILAVADAYDTLRGARPYRSAIAREDARQYLLNNAGTQFDPRIVDVFLRNLGRLEAEIVEQGFSHALDAEMDFQYYCGEAGDDEQTYVEQIKRANREVFTLYELARVFSSSLDLKETLSLFVEKIGEFVPFDTCVVYLFDETGESARAVHASGKNAAPLSGKQIKSGEGASGFVLKKRQSITDVDPGLDFTRDQPEFAEEYAGMASLPLFAEDKLLGAVSLYSCDAEIYEEEQMRLLETVARIASDAISMALHHAETESKALTDPMTGLPNARSLQAQFEREAARANRNDGNFQLLMLDLDGFKAVNDTFGHKTGDRLLKEISRVMRGQLRDYDFLARYAGDEFVVIVPETSGEDVQDLCRRIEKAVSDFEMTVESDDELPKQSARVGVSLGAASFPQHGETLDQIVAAADKRMYAAKTARKAKNQLPKIDAPPPAYEEKTVEPAFDDEAAEAAANNFIIELNESHIITSSSAIN